MAGFILSFCCLSISNRQEKSKRKAIERQQKDHKKATEMQQKDKTCQNNSLNFSKKLQKEYRGKKGFEPTEYSSAIAFIGTKDEDTMYQGTNYSKGDIQ